MEARTHLEEVLRTYDPGRDREAQFRFGTDSLASATIYLAQACWQLGDFKRARELSDEAIARAVDLAHGPTLANTWSFKAALEMYRGDARSSPARRGSPRRTQPRAWPALLSSPRSGLLWLGARSARR